MVGDGGDEPRPVRPGNLDDYLTFRDDTIDFVTARNERIRQLSD